MFSMVEEKIVTSSREELVNVTPQAEEALSRSGIRDGICFVYIPHTTAGVTINENADPDVADDLLLGLEHMIPRNIPFAHAEGNSEAHLKATLTGSSVCIPIKDFRLALGTWQGIFFCEYDGPRQRRVFFSFIPLNNG